MEKGGSLPNCYNFLHILKKNSEKYMLNCNRYSIISDLENFFSFGGIFIKKILKMGHFCHIKLNERTLGHSLGVKYHIYHRVRELFH